MEDMLASMVSSELTRDQVEAICRRVRAPLLLVHGDDDRCQPLARAERPAQLQPKGSWSSWRAPATYPPARSPVKVNLLIREFVDHLANGG